MGVKKGIEVVLLAQVAVVVDQVGIAPQVLFDIWMTVEKLIHAGNFLPSQIRLRIRTAVTVATRIQITVAPRFALFACVETILPTHERFRIEPGLFSNSRMFVQEGTKLRMAPQKFRVIQQ